MGRWTSQDPAGFIDGPNQYAFVHNNPIGNQDRFGLATEDNSPSAFEGYMFGNVETHCYCERHRTCKRGGDIWTTIGSRLPTVSYCDSFESWVAATDSLFSDYMYPSWLPHMSEKYQKMENPFSATYDLSDEGAPELSDGLGIGFINGIDNTYGEGRTSVRYISRLAGGCNVHAVYNATHRHGIDLPECIMNLSYFATPPVRQLHKMWNSFFERSSANFLMICHSQGAIHVRNALLDYPQGLRDRILVVAIAPASYIYQGTCAQLIHYRAEAFRDFIPRFDISGARRSKNAFITLSLTQR